VPSQARSTPSMTPYLPITPQQIADQAVEAAAAGAAILHLHARIPETGAPPQDPKLYEQFVPEIRDQCDAILNITTGGGLGMPLDERLAAARWAEPELASMNMGSVNFNISSAAARISEFKNDWKKRIWKGPRISSCPTPSPKSNMRCAR